MGKEPEAMKRIPRELAKGCMFDRDVPPALRVKQEEPFVLETRDCFGGALTTNDQLPNEQTLPGLFGDTPEGNYLTGPVYVEGAVPGDVLAVTVHEVTPVAQGVTILSPAAGGILADTAEWADTVKPQTRIVKLAPGPSGTTRDGHGDIGDGRLLPLVPMIGTIGIAPPGERLSSVTRQGAWGGNLDCRDIREGTTVYFNCFNDGGLLSIGDVHCMQGAGELTGCACDVPADVTLSCRAIKSKRIRGIRLETENDIIAMGIDRPLERSVATATSNLLHWLVTEYDLDGPTAYMLTSISAQFNLNIYQLIPASPDLKFPVGAQISKSVIH
jgi:amidase